MKAEKVWSKNTYNSFYMLRVFCRNMALQFTLHQPRDGTLLLALDVDAAKTEAERFVAGYLKSTIAAYSAMVDVLDASPI